MSPRSDNKIVVSLLKKSVGVREKKSTVILCHDLDALAGSWMREEAAAFERALSKQRTVDPDLWRR